MNGWLKKADDWINVHRPWALLITVSFTIGAVALINSITGSDLFRQFFFPKVCASNKPLTCDPLAWKDLFQAAILILGLPVAFLLWHWRDRNVRDQIDEQRNQVENARKDINLKEFQEVQLRAAGALDEKLPAEAREQLQIAALHQLRGFLRGEYGESFERPAFELLLAGHAAAMERVGLLEAINTWRANSPQIQSMGDEVRLAIQRAKKRWNAIDRERARIIADEWRAVFNKKWPLRGRRFDGINLPEDAVLCGLNLIGSVFIDAHLGPHLEGVKLFGAHLEGAMLESASLKRAYLNDAHLEGAHLTGVRLEGANLHGIDPASLDPFLCAVYDDDTIFAHHIIPVGDDPTADEVCDQWRAKGARHVDEIQQLG